jgi:hypothetical protein
MVNDWLVVWIFVPFSWGNFIIPTDEVHQFFRGVAKNHQPDFLRRRGKEKDIEEVAPWHG